MPPLVIDGSQQSDHWQHLTDEVRLVEQDLSVSMARWHAERDILLEHAQLTEVSLGVRLSCDNDPLQLKKDIDHLRLIVINITKAADGRIFSIAARLREHLNYCHELRVSGELTVDQLVFMQRCGINAFELPENLDPNHLKAFYRLFYQAGSPYSSHENLITSSRHKPLDT